MATSRRDPHRSALPADLWRALRSFLVPLGLWLPAMLLAGVLAPPVAIMLDRIVDLPAPPQAQGHVLRVVPMLALIYALVHVAGRIGFARATLREEDHLALDVLTATMTVSLTALFVFFFTDLVFNASWYAATGIAYAGFLVIGHAIARCRARRSLSGLAIETVASATRMVRTPLGCIAVLVVLIPVASAKLYRVDPDLANAVTRLRVLLNVSEDADRFAIVEALPGHTFLQPMLARTKPDDPEAVFVLERAGRIWRIDLTGTDAPTLALDIRERVSPPVIENGALGFAFSPSPTGDFVYL